MDSIYRSEVLKRLVNNGKMKAIDEGLKANARFAWWKLRPDNFETLNTYQQFTLDIKFDFVLGNDDVEMMGWNRIDIDSYKSPAKHHFTFK